LNPLSFAIFFANGDIIRPSVAVLATGASFFFSSFFWRCFRFFLLCRSAEPLAYNYQHTEMSVPSDPYESCHQQVLILLPDV
jgi:hypothetical protein